MPKTIRVIIDRPLGSRHPRWPETVYPVNYGFVPGVMAADDAEQDAYVLGIDVPLAEFTGELAAVIHRLDDVETKWVVVPPGYTITVAEIAAQTAFQERFFQTAIELPE